MNARGLIAVATLLLCTGCASTTKEIGGGILRKDAVWSGAVRLTGVVLVERGVHLRIEPGTEVIFAYTDDDGDGIGDGTLNVLGTLTAVGTPEEPVIFRSSRGRKKDWTFLHLSGSGESRVEKCVIRDAFTGIQLHYTRARVANCLFVNNHEGLRYSTIRGDIRHNTFTGNTVGIRFEGRQSTVLVEKNLFTDNGTAVFPVMEGAAGDRFRRNSFTSTGYNVRLGIGQKDDLDFSGNYWGTDDGDLALSSIYDGRADDALGRVRIDPILPEPVGDAGLQEPLAYTPPGGGD